MALNLNLAFSLGETWVIDLPIAGPEGPLTQADIADVQFRLATSQALVLDLALDDGVEFTGDAPARARVTLTPNDQAALSPSLHRYEIRALGFDGDVTVQQFGTMNIRPSLFRDFPPRPDNPPSGIFLSPDIVAGGVAPGVFVGFLTGFDPDPHERLAFQLVDGLSGRFAVSGAELRVGSAGISVADVGQTLTPVVRVTDRGGLTFDRAIPVIILSAGILRGDLASQSGLLNMLGVL